MLPLGYELEFKGASLLNLSKTYNIPLYKKEKDVSYDHFHLKDEKDVSVIDQRDTTIDYLGGELISPIFTNFQKCLQETKKYLTWLKEQGAYIEKNSYDTGFHIHLDLNFLDSCEKKQKLLKFLYAFQNEIYQLAKGKDEKIRANSVIYATPLREKIVRKIITNEAYLSKLAIKHHCIRFTKNTFELRYFNSSLDERVLINDLYFSIHLRDFIRFDTENDELVTYYFERMNDNYPFELEKQNVMKKMLKL